MQKAYKENLISNHTQGNSIKIKSRRKNLIKSNYNLYENFMI